MAELRIGFVEQDYDALIRWLLDQGAWFVPEGPYDTDFYAVVSDPAVLHPWLIDTFPVFICHDSFFRQPLEMTLTEGGIYQGRYFVSQREGGPAIHFFCGVKAAFLDRKIVPMGYISHWSKYLNHRAGEDEPASPELKAFFRDIASYIRNNGLKLSVHNMVYWIGQHAVRALAGGYKLGIDGVEEAKTALTLLKEQNSAKKFEKFLAGGR